MFSVLFCCFQSASPDNSNPQAPPRRRRPSKKLIVINEQNPGHGASNHNCSPRTAPAEDIPFTYDTPESTSLQQRSQSIGSNIATMEAPAPGLNIIPPTPMIDRRIQETSPEHSQKIQSNKNTHLNACAKKMIATRTTSLPLVTLPSDILEETVMTSKSKSQSQENFTTNQTDVSVPDHTDSSPGKTVDIEHDTKHHHHSQRYSMKSFKKRLKKGVKKRDKSSERNHKTIDPNENHIAVETECIHDDYGSHGSRSENEEYPLTDDDLLSPAADDSAFHGDKKEGFFRRMSVKVKQFVTRHDDELEIEGEVCIRKTKKMDRILIITDLTDESDCSKPVCTKKTLKEVLSHGQGRCLTLWGIGSVWRHGCREGKTNPD